MLGCPPKSTVGFPGVQGTTVLGIQGIGVKTPKAAAVAAATIGFAKDRHIPKGIIFIIGLLSIIFAAGLLSVKTLFKGKITKVPGASPKVHFNVAPLHTCIPIFISFLFYIF
jgi:hypothetical protein